MRVRLVRGDICVWFDFTSPGPTTHVTDTSRACFPKRSIIAGTFSERPFEITKKWKLEAGSNSVSEVGRSFFIAAAVSLTVFGEGWQHWTHVTWLERKWCVGVVYERIHVSFTQFKVYRPQNHQPLTIGSIATPQTHASGTPTTNKGGKQKKTKTDWFRTMIPVVEREKGEIEMRFWGARGVLKSAAFTVGPFDFSRQDRSD